MQPGGVEELHEWWGSAALTASFHLEDDFVLEFHFDVSDEIQVSFNGSALAFTAGVGI